MLIQNELDATPPGIVALDALRGQKAELAQAQYAQVYAITDYYYLCSNEDERRGINPAHSGMHAAVELSAALGMNEGTVTASIELGLELRHRLHRTREAFATGRIDLAQARVISAMLTGVSDAALDILESAVLEGGNVPPTTLRVRCRRLIAKHDPGSLRRRAKLAAADRDVRVRPAENGMSFVDGHLPAADAHAIGMRLREMAIHDVCTGDPRTLAQRRADALTALADGSGRLLCRCLDVGCHTRTRPAPTRRAPLIQVVINAETLLGLDETPAHLDGYGPIDADTARLLAADGVFQRVHALTENDVSGDGSHILGISAIVKHPGVPKDLIRNDTCATTYTPGTAQSRRIRTRDGQCRFPNCQVPARHCDLDHTTPFDHDDPKNGDLTVDSNLACLCRRHHRLKTRGLWTVKQSSAGHLEWTTPHGETMYTEPEGAAVHLARTAHTSRHDRTLALMTRRSHAEHDLDYLIELHRTRRSAPIVPGITQIPVSDPARDDPPF
ncbi:HNH endonuclease signature motif containing protein [Rhodococcus oxybenzonivorans]|nr:HNH endonuclease signature motif containing protein [Rhodococcus oxybenzonivorans]